MKFFFKKKFVFSASFAQGKKIIGHNYTLTVTCESAPSEVLEFEAEQTIRKSLIQKLESRDLGLHVDFLKDVEITDENLLKIFWQILEKELKNIQLYSLALERDDRTELTLTV